MSAFKQQICNIFTVKQNRLFLVMLTLQLHYVVDHQK